jgi:HlyD family secretion protein
MTRKHRRVWWWGVGALVLVAGGFALAGSSGSQSPIDPSQLATVERGTMVQSVVATGKVEPIGQVEIKSKANGIIEKLYVDIGDRVKVGQVLAELDKATLVAQLREAQANLQAAEASVTGARAQLEKNRIEAEGPDVEFTRRAAERARQLSAQKLLPASELDQAASNYELAVNKQRSASGQLAVAKANVSQAQAQVAQARAAVSRAEEDVRNATIRSPIDGTVLTRDVEVGSPVSSILNLGANATLVMTLGDISNVFVRGEVDEADIGRIRVGQAARISVETFKNRTFEGKVTQISPMGVEVDNVTTFEVKVSIQNPGNLLLANMTANAAIILETRPNALIVPEAAITYDNTRKAFVDVPDSHAAGGRRRVAVEIGIGDGTRTQVLSGLTQGDKVILPS